MLLAAGWGFAAAFSLVVGGLLGVYVRTSERLIGLVMAFGVGVLFSAAAFELTEEAYAAAGGPAVAAGLAAGSLVFFLGDWVIDRYGGHRRKSPRGHQAGAGAMALALGAALDGVPESAAIGVSLLGDTHIGVAFVAAVFISNIPEAFSASAGMRRDGRPVRVIMAMWVGIAVLSAVSAAIGYGALGQASAELVAATSAFAAGAIITMLVDTMVPEAVEHAGRWVGLLTMLGFGTAFLLRAAT